MSTNRCSPTPHWSGLFCPPWLHGNPQFHLHPQLHLCLHRSFHLPLRLPASTSHASRPREVRQWSLVAVRASSPSTSSYLACSLPPSSLSCQRWLTSSPSPLARPGDGVLLCGKLDYWVSSLLFCWLKKLCRYLTDPNTAMMPAGRSCSVVKKGLWARHLYPMEQSGVVSCLVYSTVSRFG